MLVKRMMESLKRQDWTMVAIEFVLVVIGVLMGFKINDWASHRASANAREQTTERLLEEAERDVAYIRQAVDFEQRNVHALKRIFAGVDAKDASAASDEAVTSRLVGARSIVALAPPSSVYEDIVSSGELNQIGDTEVRAAISRYRSTLSFEERMREQLQSGLHDYERIPAFRYRPNAEGTMSVDVDFPALVGDPRSQQAIALAAENHRIVLMLRSRALRDSETMCERLGEAVGRPCNRNLPPPKF